MSEYCGKIVTIMHVLPNCYWLVETSDNWTDEMIDETYDFKQLAIGEVFDNKEYYLLSEQEKTLLYNATVLLENVVIRMQNHGDYSLTKK